MNGKEFVSNIKRFKSNVKVKTAQVARQKALELFNKVIERTPVDTGYARAGWQISYGNLPVATPPSPGTTRGLSTSELFSGTEGWDPEKGIIWLANAVPYIRVLEYGGYPNPVMRGTYLKKGQTKGEFTGPGYFQLSEGGFSKQLPQGGMVRMSLMEMGKR